MTSFEATIAAHTVAIHNRLRREATENAAINTEGRGSAIDTVAEIMVAATNALRGPGCALRGSRSRAACRRAKGNKIHVPIVAAKKINSLSGDPSLSLNRTEKTAKSPITATAAMTSFCHSGRLSIASDFRNNFITRTSLSRPAARAVSPAGRILCSLTAGFQDHDRNMHAARAADLFQNVLHMRLHRGHGHHEPVGNLLII